MLVEASDVGAVRIMEIIANEREEHTQKSLVFEGNEVNKLGYILTKKVFSIFLTKLHGLE